MTEKTSELCADTELVATFIANGRNDEAKVILRKYPAEAFGSLGTLVHQAVSAKRNNKEILLILVEKGADIECKDVRGRTPLGVAIERNRSWMVKVLLDAGANIDAVANANGQSALQMVAHPRYNISPVIVRAFIRRVRIEEVSTEEVVDKLFTAGFTLHHVACAKDVEVVEGMLRRGLNVNSRNSIGATALHVAVKVDDLETVKLLVGYGAEVNALDNGRRAPLHYAARNGNAAVLRFLLERCVRFNPIDRRFENLPLCEIFMGGKVDDDEQIRECVEIMLQHGAFPQSLRQNVAIAIIYSNDVFVNSPKGLNCLVAHLAMLETIDTTTVRSMSCCIVESRREVFKKLKESYDKNQRVLKTTIFKKLSLLDLLADSECKMRGWVRNEAFVRTVEDFCAERELQKHHSYYYNTLTRRISKALRIVKLEDQAILVICKIFQKNVNKCYVVAREIFNYLSGIELEHFCRALD